MRHPTRKAIDKFNKLFDIKEDPESQDWEIEYSDPSRLNEYIEYYYSHTDNDDEKFTLMALILGGFEEYHTINPPDREVWNKVKGILIEDINIHKDHIVYYQCLDTEDEEYHFPITKLMREIKI